MSSEFDRIVQKLRDARSLLCLTHARPDGDGLGAMVALTQAARDVGKTALSLIEQPAPWRYQFLFEELGEGSVSFVDALDSQAAQADLIVVLDTCSREQLGEIVPKLEALRSKIVLIDHHRTSDDIGVVRWLDESAAAVGVMTLELLEALGWPLGRLAVRALATAVVSDTGWLRFSNTDGRCLRAMARLVEKGAAVDDLYRRIYQSDRPQRLRLLQRVLASLELYCEERLAVMVLRKADFAETGACPDETENLINEAFRLGCVEAAVLLVENPAPAGPEAECIRVSLRSRQVVDVSEIAAKFGGGGHARAAGLRQCADLDDLKTRLIAAVASALPA
jgi:phosphoesterase RecJ-like protein